MDEEGGGNRPPTLCMYAGSEAVKSPLRASAFTPAEPWDPPRARSSDSALAPRGPALVHCG